MGKLRPGRAADQSLPSNALVMKEYSYNSTHHLGHNRASNGNTLPFFTYNYIIELYCTESKINIYRNIILPLVLYGCETWSLTLTEERRLRVFENKVLRRIFGRDKDEVRREWRKLHNKELNDLYASLNIVWVIKSSRIK